MADELGIDPGLIYAWRSTYKKKSQQSFPGKGVPSRTTKEKELAELKKELAEVRMERDILKKAMGIFTKKNGCSTNLGPNIRIYFP